MIKTTPRRDDAELYAEHAPRLLGLAAVLAGPAVADDVVSTTFVRALSSPGWGTVENPGAYLTRTLVNSVRSDHRSALRREARERAAAGPEVVQGSIDLTEVLEALALLPLRQRAVIFLTYWRDLSPVDVARELDISEGSVRKHLARGRAALRRRLS